MQRKKDSYSIFSPTRKARLNRRQEESSYVLINERLKEWSKRLKVKEFSLLIRRRSALWNHSPNSKGRFEESRLIRSQWIKTHFIKRKDWIIIKSGVQGKKSIFTPLRGSPIGFKGARKNGMDKQGYLCKFKEIRLLAKMKISKLSYCDWGNFIPLFRDWGGFRFFNLSRPNFNRCRLIGRFIPLRTY